MLNKIDEFILEQIGKSVDGFHWLTGQNKFCLGRLALSVNAALEFEIWLAGGSRQHIIGAFCAILLIIYSYHGERKSEADSKGKAAGSDKINLRAVRVMFLLLQGFGMIIMFGLNIVHGDNSDMPPSFVSTMFFLLYIYIISCETVPAGQGKIQSWLKSFKRQPPSA